MENIQKRKPHYAWLILLSCAMFIMGILGIAVNTIGLFLKPVADSLGVSVSAVVWPHIGIWHLVMAIFLPISGSLIGKIDIRILLTLSCISYAGGYLVMSFGQNLSAFYIGGALTGLGGVYFMYNAIPTLLTNWFKKYLGTILGFIFILSSIVGSFYSPFLSNIITTYGWRVAYRISACIMLVSVLPFTLFVVRLHPKDKGLLPYGADEVTEEESPVNVEEKGFSIREAFKNPGTWILMLAILCIMASMEMNNMLPTYAQYAGFTSTVAAMCTSLAMVGTSIGKAGLGWLSDKFGVFRVTVGGLLVAIAGTICFIIAFGNGSIFTVYCGAIGFGFGYSMQNVLLPSATKTLLGQKNFAKIYSLLTTPGVWVQTFGSTILALLYEKTGSFYPAVYALLTLFIVAMVAMTILNFTNSKVISQWKD